MPKPKKPAGIVHTCNGHTIVMTIREDGKRDFFCSSWPSLAARHNGAADGAAAFEEFDQRASGGAVAADDSAKGAA